MRNCAVDRGLKIPRNCTASSLPFSSTQISPRQNRVERPEITGPEFGTNVALNLHRGSYWFDSSGASVCAAAVEKTEDVWDF